MYRRSAWIFQQIKSCVLYYESCCCAHSRNMLCTRYASIGAYISYIYGCIKIYSFHDTAALCTYQFSLYQVHSISSYRITVCPQAHITGVHYTLYSTAVVLVYAHTAPASGQVQMRHTAADGALLTGYHRDVNRSEL